jgi:hypothetical protein
MFRTNTHNHRSNANRTLVFITFSLLICALPAVASAAKPPTNNNSQLSIAASPKQVTFGGAVTISGKLKGSGSAGQGVQLDVNPYPFTAYVGSAVATTDASGNYRFTAKPSANTRYRVETTTVTPALTSGEITVPVAPKISLRLSDRTPAAGKLVRFSGYVWPAHDGRTAQLQRLTTTGAWKTVARLSLGDDGELRSKYARRVRVRKDGSYRVQLLADVDHVTGFSATKTARVH